jgi:hypothetical protein
VNRQQISRSDFPPSEAGYDRASVEAHLEAVAAFTAALEAQVKALEVERDALRRQLEAARAVQSGPDPVNPPRPAAQPDPASSELDPPSSESASESEQPEPQEEDPAHAARPDEEVSARLVASKLALDGVDREQIREKLESAFDLDDPDSLLDDVLERLA